MRHPSALRDRSWLVGVLAAGVLATLPRGLAAQEPAAWGNGDDIPFHTFSIVAVDPRTGETGATVTTRNECVGNAVPWVRAGVGAVATQGGTRVEYGKDLLDMIQAGMSPKEALDKEVAADPGRESRQVGVIDSKGRAAQWTGKGQYGSEDHGDFVNFKIGEHFAVQGNSLVGPEVVDSVFAVMQRSEGSKRWLADRLIEALNAGHVLGGDGRHGETESAAVIVADPRPGMSRRPDGQSVFINVCEAPDAVAEMRRVYNTITETLGFRDLSQEIGSDIYQLKVILHALGYFRPGQPDFDRTEKGITNYTQDAVDAVDAFKRDQHWQTTVPGFVDKQIIARMWQRLEEKGLADQVRDKLLPAVRVTR
jgi:uncharacterized Ntn-hydrolase superfamily protein